MLKLRHTNRALLDGNYTAVNESDANVLSYLRVYKDQGVAVALNMSDTPQKVNLELKHNGFSSAKSLLATGKSAAKGDEVSLDPYGFSSASLRNKPEVRLWAPKVDLAAQQWNSRPGFIPALSHVIHLGARQAWFKWAFLPRPVNNCLHFLPEARAQTNQECGAERGCLRHRRAHHGNVENVRSLCMSA